MWLFGGRGRGRRWESNWDEGVSVGGGGGGGT